MESLLVIFLSISVMFFILLGVKEMIGKKAGEKFCTICLAVSFTWVIFLALYWTGVFEEKIILALLMGQTSLGVFYILERKMKEEYKVFRLPLLLTLVLAFYVLLQGYGNVLWSGSFIIGAWGFFFFIFAFRTNSKFGNFAKKLVECCRNW